MWQKGLIDCGVVLLLRSGGSRGRHTRTVHYLAFTDKGNRNDNVPDNLFSLLNGKHL